jgi:outer membrane protein OmpA-like peptidoglycan-associated protein/ABC-type amino acid transport substrate-binding protein
MRVLRLLSLAALVGLLLVPAPRAAEKTFAETVGAVAVGDVKVKAGDVIDLPILTWGGDVPVLMANGGKGETKKDSDFGKLDLKFNIKADKGPAGDDFVGQVKDYLAGKTPFLRGTMSQLGLASEVVGKDPRTKPVVFMQLTWSAGDHMVARPTVKNVNDLKGKTIALQRGGPHIGFLDDTLKSAKLDWKDVTVVWTDDLTGDKGPAEAFRKNDKIDACFVITPDMEGLTTGLEKVGPGTEKTVKGAKVINSTKYLTRSIADVYACRKDFYDKNQEMIEKFAGAYLANCEKLVTLAKSYKDKKDKATLDEYRKVLMMCQDVFTKEVLPENDAADGFIADATFVALPGNATFFSDKNGSTGFVNRMKAAVDVAVQQGWAKEKIELLPSTLDFSPDGKVKNFGKLKVVKGEDPKPFVDPEVLPDSKDAIYSFSILFDPDKGDTKLDKYDKDFEKVVQDARLYGHALFAVRGHADITKALSEFVKAGIETKQIRREGKEAPYKYFLVKENKEIDLNDTKKVLELIEKMDFRDAKDDPKATVDAAKKLSDKRANFIRDAIVDFAKKKGLPINPSQLKAVGVGVSEPVVPKPKNEDETAKNRRVEFQVLKVSPELVKKKDFDI